MRDAVFTWRALTPEEREFLTRGWEHQYHTPRGKTRRRYFSAYQFYISVYMKGGFGSG